MKKFIFGAALVMSLGAVFTSCGGGEKAAVNTDTVISKQLSDSVSLTLGAMTGLDVQAQLGQISDPEQFLKVFQLIIGRDYTPQEFMALNAGAYAVQQIMNLKSQGVDIDRDLFLQEFRKYFSDGDRSGQSRAVINTQAQELGTQLQNIFVRREAMRNGISPDKLQQPQAPATPEPVAEEPQTPAPAVQVTETVSETVTVDSVAELPAQPTNTK